MTSDYSWHTLLLLVFAIVLTVLLVLAILQKAGRWKIVGIVVGQVLSMAPLFEGWFASDAAPPPVPHRRAPSAVSAATFMNHCAKLPRDAKTCTCALAEMERRIGRVRFGQIASANATLPENAVRMSIATCTDREANGYAKALDATRKRCERKSTPAACACFVARVRTRWPTATSRATDADSPASQREREAHWAAECGARPGTLP